MPGIEFEHKGSKIAELTNNCVVMTAGNALVGRNLFRDVKAKLGSAEDIPISDVVSLLKNVYIEHKNKLAEDLHLKGRGITFHDFYGKYINEWPQPLAMGLDQQIQATDLGIEILIAGVDSEPHIYTIVNPGQEACWDNFFFCAVGSGTPLAMLQWVAECHGPAESVVQALYVSHDAKRRAEAHSGVGLETDMFIIRRTGLTQVQDATITAIRNKQEEHSNQPYPDISEVCGQLTLCEITEEVAP